MRAVDDTVEVLNEAGEVVARAGEWVSMGGGFTPVLSDDYVWSQIPPQCRQTNNYWIACPFDMEIIAGPTDTPQLPTPAIESLPQSDDTTSPTDNLFDVTPLPTATPTLAVTVTPEGKSLIAPLAQAPYAVFGGWSPDDRWIAYWLSSAEDVAAQQPYTMPGGTLHFVNVITGETCAVSRFHTRASGEAEVLWHEDGTVTITIEDSAFRGLPCQDETFSPVDQDAPAETADDDRVLSPDGRFQAVTTLESQERGILTLETTLVYLEDGRTVQRMTWQKAEALGEIGLGGEWASRTQFLIYGTLTEGPLLIDVEEGVVSVATKLFGFDPTEVPSLLGPEGYELGAAVAPGYEPDTFHLLLLGTAGTESNFPPVRLLHVESGQMEELPYRHTWPQPFSPDRRWLLMLERTPEDKVALWTRRTEEVNGQWQLLASNTGYNARWNPEWTEMAFNQGTWLIWQTFPEAEIIGRWYTEQYTVSPVAWSHDGRFLAAVGNQPGQWQYGLFILTRP